MKKTWIGLFTAAIAFGLQAATVTRNIGSGLWDFNTTAFNSGGTLWTNNEDTAQFNLGSGGTMAVSDGIGARGILLTSGNWTFSSSNPFTFGPDGITLVGGSGIFAFPFQYSGAAALPITGNNNGGTLVFSNVLGAAALSIAKPRDLLLKLDYTLVDAAKFSSGATVASSGNTTLQFLGGTAGETFGTLSAGSGSLALNHWTNNTGLIQIGAVQRADGLGAVHLVDEFSPGTARPFRITGMQNTNGFVAPWVTVCFGNPSWSPRFATILGDGTVEKIVSSTQKLNQWFPGTNAVISTGGLDAANIVPVCSVNSLALSPYNSFQGGSLNLFGADITIASGALLKTDGATVMSNGTLRAGSEGRFYLHAFNTFDTENFFGPNAAGILPEIVKFQSGYLYLRNPTNQFSGFSVLGGAVYMGGNRATQAIGPVFMNPSTLFFVTNSSPVFGNLTLAQSAVMTLTNCAQAVFGSANLAEPSSELRIQGTPKATLSGFSGIGTLNVVNMGSAFELAFSAPAIVTNNRINITAPSGVTIRTVGDTWLAGVNGLDAAIPVTLTAPVGSTNTIANLLLGTSNARTLTFTGGCWPFNVFSGSQSGTIVIQDGARVALTNGQTLLCGGQMTIRNGGALVSESGTFGWGAQGSSVKTNVLTIEAGGLLNLRSSRYHCWRICGERSNDGKVMIVNQAGGKVMVGVETGSDPNSGHNRDLIFGYGQNNNPALAEAVYNLSGGELQIAGELQAYVNGLSTNRFEFTGGTLAVRQINTTNLTSAAVALVPDVFVNNGGRFSPGGDDVAGFTEIYGNYTVLSPNAEHLFSIGGASLANAFQNTGAYSDYILIRRAGIAQFAGKLRVKVINGYVPPTTQTFTLINTMENAVLSGAFDGFVNGTGTVYSTDGAYRFTGVMTASTLTLSNARPNEWAAGDSADWTNGWQGDQVPGIGNMMNAVFGMSATNNATVTLNAAATPALLLFDNYLRSYLITGSGSLAASSIMVRSGSHTVSVPVAQAVPLVVTVSNTLSRAGLYAGRAAVAGGVYSQPVNPRWAVECYADYSKALYIRYTSSAVSAGIWEDNSVRIYSGWIYNPAATPAVWTFAKKFDDAASLKVDDTQYDFGALYSQLMLLQVTLRPGWNAFELRCYQGGGDVGAMDGWGIVYDPLGRASANRADYLELNETGDGAFLRTESAEVGAVVVRNTLTLTAPVTAPAVTVNGGGELKAAQITADAVTIADGTRVSISDVLQTSSLTMGTGAVLNFVSSAAQLILLGADIDAARTFVLAGKFAAFGSVTDKPAAFGIALVEGGVRVRPLNSGTQVIVR